MMTPRDVEGDKIDPAALQLLQPIAPDCRVVAIVGIVGADRQPPLAINHQGAIVYLDYHSRAPSTDSRSRAIAALIIPLFRPALATKASDFSPRPPLPSHT